MNTIPAYTTITILAAIGWTAWCLSHLNTSHQYRKGALPLLTITITAWTIATIHLTQTT